MYGDIGIWEQGVNNKHQMINNKSITNNTLLKHLVLNGYLWICVLILLINVAYAITGVWRFGSQHVDAYGIWLLKAKAMTIERGIPWQLLRNPEYHYSHQTYPLLLPYLLSWGSWTLWLYPMVYVTILGLLYHILRGEGHDQLHALGWVTVASYMGPLIAQGGRLHAGLADIWITLLVALCMRFTQKQQWWGIVGIIMIASMIKTEGIFLLGFLINTPHLSPPSYFRRKEVKEGGIWVLRCIVAIIPFVIWQIVVQVGGIPSDVVFGWPGVGELMRRLGMVIVGVGEEMVNWRNWYVVWGIFLIRFFSSIRKSRSPACNALRSNAGRGCELNLLESRNKYWWNVLGLMVLGYAGVYVFANLDTTAYVRSSVDRIMLQLLPLWWVVMAKFLSRETIRTENNNKTQITNINATSNIKRLNI